MKRHATNADLSAYIDGALPREMHEKVENHLLACPVCAEKSRCLHELNAQLQSLPSETIGFDLTPMIEARLNKSSVRSRTRRWHQPSWRLVPVSLAISFVLLFGTYLGNGLVAQSQQLSNATRLTYLAVLDPLPSAYSCKDFMSCES